MPSLHLLKYDEEDIEEQEPNLAGHPDESGGQREYIDRGNVVVPFSRFVRKVVLAKLKGDLQYFGGFLRHYEKYDVANYDDKEGSNFKNRKILRNKVTEIISQIKELEA